MQRSSIHPSIFQAFFDSASNAADKGQAQWFTPPEWGKVLSRPLARYRPVIVDLCCGDGRLLQSARVRGSQLLGCDIQGEDRGSKIEDGKDRNPSSILHSLSSFVQCDVTHFFTLLHAVKWEADCFVLNPPWDLHWYRERLSPLAHSECDAVREAFAQPDGRLSKETIDSTAATLMMALDRMSHYGEGLLIANEATLQRLILTPDAPHSALAEHVWAHLSVAGNICQTILHSPSSEFRTGILWFSRWHRAGLRADAEGVATNLRDAEQFTDRLAANRSRLRRGPEPSDYQITPDTTSLWQAAAGEWSRLNPNPNLNLNPYHLWLEHGFIRTNLSLFDTASGRVGKEEAAKLHELMDKQPMQLVIDRNSRRALLAAAGMAGPTPWRVCPKLIAAVHEAMRQFNEERTPLAALPSIQRLGFLDEHDFITCRRDLGEAGAGHSRPLFRAGEKYPLRSGTVLVKRQSEKLNLLGVPEAVELDGQELAFFIGTTPVSPSATLDLPSAPGHEVVFMEARLREPGVTVSVIKPGVREVMKRLTDQDLTPCPIDYTLPELVDHFEIPAVPHGAVVFQQEYERHLQQLEEIERLVNA